MRILVLTSLRHGYASHVLPELCANPQLQVVKVILAHGLSPDRKKGIKRKLLKTTRIGLLGAFNGMRLRKWYADKDADDIYSVCNSLTVPLLETRFLNSDVTRKLFEDADVDLGLSLGNSYIPKNVFSIPRYGMVNIHTEVLPDFQGAQSIIWPIHERIGETGFTIHQINSKIDAGEILYQKRYPIEFYPTLRETVEKNLLIARAQIPKAFSYVCEHYTTLRAQSISQEHKKTYTTPTIWQFLRMVKNNRSMYQRSLNSSYDSEH